MWSATVTRSGNRGWEDGLLFGTSCAIVEMLNKHNFNVAYNQTSAAHTWSNWRDYLNELAPELLQ